MKALLEKGINLLLPPREHVEPGDLLLADPDNSIRSGSWQPVFGLQTAPKVEADPGFRSFAFQANSITDAKTSASLLGRVLAQFGLGSGSFSGAFGAANAAIIELELIAPANRILTNFDEVLEELRAAGVSPTRDYSGKRFLIVEKVWRARGLRLRVLNKDHTQVELKAEALKELSAAAALALTREDSGSYAFTAQKALIFGLTMREIVFVDGVIADRPNTAPKTFRGGPAENSDYAFIGDDAFVSFPVA